MKEHWRRAAGMLRQIINIAFVHDRDSRVAHDLLVAPNGESDN